MNSPLSNIVSTDWLNHHLEDPNIVILDATLKKRPNGELINHVGPYIKGAQEFNYDTDICDRETNLPHMLPSLPQFEAAVRERGVSKNSLVICYDAMGIFSSPRAWWMFKIMGHDNVAILNGGLPQWLDEKRPTQNAFSGRRDMGDFEATFRPELLYTAQQVLRSIEDPKVETIDARSYGRFNATEPEPRPGMRGGHIPGSTCIPFTELLEDGRFKSQVQLKSIFEKAFQPNATRKVFSCGSGVTASILALAAAECGYENLAVYDGSWAEWAENKDLPIEI